MMCGPPLAPKSSQWYINDWRFWNTDTQSPWWDLAQVLEADSQQFQPCPAIYPIGTWANRPLPPGGCWIPNL